MTEDVAAEIGIGAVEMLAPPAGVPAWPRRPHRLLGEPAAGQPAVAIAEGAFAAAHHHAAASEAEVGGLLLGAVCNCAGTTHVEVEATLPAESTRCGPAHLTWTADSWSGLLRHKESRHSSATIVGWYHSHPRMGIFLSEMDLTLHRGFFGAPWHIALVVNGHDRRAGVFVWEGGQVRPARHLVWLPAGRQRFTVVSDASSGRLAYRPPWPLR